MLFFMPSPKHTFLPAYDSIDSFKKNFLCNGQLQAGSVVVARSQQQSTACCVECAVISDVSLMSEEEWDQHTLASAGLHLPNKAFNSTLHRNTFVGVSMGQNSAPNHV